jgi:signal transduction histidine kinase
MIAGRVGVSCISHAPGVLFGRIAAERHRLASHPEASNSVDRMTPASDGTKTPTHDFVDSQHALALSIARAVQLELPEPDSPDAITGNVEQALHDEAVDNERMLAYLRVGFLGVFAGSAVAAWFDPALADLSRVPLASLGIVWLWLGVALTLVVLLRQGWYQPWLRRVVPAMDAVVIATTFAVFQWRLPNGHAPLPGGFVAVAATACVFLAFSGALRLSRSAARLSTGLATATWLVIAFLGGVRVVPALLIAALVLATGILGTRVTRMLRRVITNEVARLRLVQMYHRAEAAIDAREQVLGVVAHDLRNPLGTIKMAAEMLQEEVVPVEEYPKYLGSIQRAGDRMNRLIQDLLDVARMEAGRLPVEPTRVQVDALLADVAEMMRPHAVERGLVLDVVCPAELPAVRVDAERIGQVFSNLVGNAIKFTPPGGRIWLRAERMGDKVRLSVADTGPGIPPEKLPEIFAPFWQADRMDRRGLGLGLSIAKGIIEAHQERIGVESRPGEGTEFWFTAPVEEERSTSG